MDLKSCLAVILYLVALFGTPVAISWAIYRAVKGRKAPPSITGD
jgi:hypothetical protein